MSLKIKVILLSLICTLTISLFAGCDTWSHTDSSTKVPFTNPINPVDKSKDDNFNPSNEDLVGDSLLDVSTLYDCLGGFKIAYDGTENKLEILNDANFEVTYSRIKELAVENNNIDCKRFVETNSDLGVTEDYVSRVVWILNYVNQYQSLASMILTEIAKNYGFGLDFFTLNNALYGKVNYDSYSIASNGYETNKNAINLGVYEVVQSVTLKNPNFGDGSAIFDDGNSQIDINNEEYLQINLDFDIPTKAYAFALNLKQQMVAFKFTILNPYFDQNNLVNQPLIDNPNYDENDPESPQQIDNPNYIADHLFSKENLTFVGQVGENDVVSYDLGATDVILPTADDFASDYVQNYANYLGLKLLQTHLQTSNIVNLIPELVTDFDYVDLYAEWSEKIGSLGFSETIVDESDNQMLLCDVFTNCVLENVIGEDVLNLNSQQTDFARDFESTVENIVANCVSAKVTETESNLVFDSINGKVYFPKVYNIEWKDYTAEELFKTDANGETMSLPEERIYSLVFMLKEGYEPTVFQAIMLMMLAPNEALKIDLNFRYIKNGEEKINDFVDYTLQPPLESGLVNTFDGNIEKYDGQEITLEYADAHCFAIEDYNTPKLNTIKNQELIIEKFANNLPSNFCASLNSTFGDSRFAYDESKEIFFYNEINDCDFVEIGFKITSEAESPTLKLNLTLMDVLATGLEDLQN